MATAPAYSLAAWRKYREQRDQPKLESVAPSTLDSVPADAEMEAGIIVGFWNGQRFVSWEKWLATAPIERDVEAELNPIPADARCVSANCGGTRVWLVRDGDRWLMFAGTRIARRCDFASPFLGHAQRTAETWYGAAEKGWQVAEG